jgi:hypothetical protein
MRAASPLVREEAPLGGGSFATAPVHVGAALGSGRVRQMASHGLRTRLGSQFRKRAARSYSATRTASASDRPGSGATSRAVRMVLAL